MRNRSRKIARWLVERGCREFVVCAGARNAPLVLELYGLADAGDFKVWPFFEERSAAFFALGRMKETKNPVAVLTTSGTAAAELLPAVIEADYSDLPLIAVTADRPRRFRGCGSPQSIVQPGIYSHYVRTTIDFEEDHELVDPSWDQRSPLHLNVCFEEPKLSEMVREAWRISELKPVAAALAPVRPQDLGAIEKFLEVTKKPLVLVGQLERDQRAVVKEQLLRLKYPVYLESLSGLSGDPVLFDQRIWGGERCVALALEKGWADGIIRVGGLPTARVWRDLEGVFSKIPVINLSKGLPGLSRTDVATVGMESLTQWPTPDVVAVNPHWREIQMMASQRIESLVSQFPKSEPALLFNLAQSLPSEARIYLGNSLPVREWESARGRREQSWWIEGNRGVNGIDGQISTYLGFAGETTCNWAVLGDLTAMYDLVGPWVISQRKFKDLNLVVVNNSGGRIFKRMYKRVELENEHQIEFSSWAQMWHLNYELWLEVPTEIGRGENGRIIELRPDSQATDRFWQAWEGLWRELSRA